MDALCFIATKPGKEMLLIKEFDLILCSLNLMTAKLNFIILKTIEGQYLKIYI